VSSPPAVFPPEVSPALEGWDLTWFRVRATGRGNDQLGSLASEVEANLVDAFRDRAPAEDEVVRAVRRLFREAGCDPTRHRPSSEALIRRVLKRQALPRIHPLVDVNNLLSLRLRVPCCVVDPRTVKPPFELRAGRGGEKMDSMRGPFNLEGKPVLVDGLGPLGTPITDSERVKITPDCSEGWMVAYGVQGICGGGQAARELAELLRAAPVAELVA
jgi:DNA/RNA-binding domain of Phe-tRNA-synthetase-like protein